MVLISAFYCGPGKGSEQGVGWNTVREISRRHDVWVLTRTIFRSSIEVEMSRAPVPGLHFVYCDLPRWTRWWASVQALEWHFYYYVWQVYVYFVARRLHREVRFDLVHHVTFAKYWIPSFLPLLPVPFVWGPVGGGESAPGGFWHSFGLRAKASESLRDLGRWLSKHDPFLRLAARRSVLALASTEETAKRMLELGTGNLRVLSQLGLSEEEIAMLGRYRVKPDGPLRFISIGRLLYWKGFDLGLRAFAEADLPREAEYWFLGDGPERKRLETLAGDLGVKDRVRFWGTLSRDEALSKLAACHALVHPSLHDSGGAVCLEAMAAGRPVVCLDLGGPAVLLTEETGIKVHASDPEQAVRGLTSALTRLALSPELGTRMGEMGHKRASEVFGWETRGQLWERFYQEALSR